MIESFHYKIEYEAPRKLAYVQTENEVLFYEPCGNLAFKLEKKIFLENEKNISIFAVDLLR